MTSRSLPGPDSTICMEEAIPVAGIARLTTVDFPDRLSMVIFTQGCPWRCGYCHNAGLREIGATTSWLWRQVCRLLDERKGFLEAVVFSGGEPTIHAGLADAVQAVRRKGYLVGLHTAGMFPRNLSQVLPWLDWVGLDVKAPFDERYARLTGDCRSIENVVASLHLLQSSCVAFQLRTTVGKGALDEGEFEELRHQLRLLGAPDPVRQPVRPTPPALD